MTQQFWALGRWSNRASLLYVGIDRAIDNKTIDAYGRLSGTSRYESEAPRRALKIEEGSTTSYVMYDDDTNSNVPIIKIAEVS